MGQQKEIRLRGYHHGPPVRLLAFALLAIAAISPAVAQAPKPDPAPRFWLAGRYDGNHIIVLFDEIKFKGTVPRAARSVPAPTTPGFLSERELPPNYVGQLPRGPKAERFRLGDPYDVLLGDGRIDTVTISTLVGYVSDDEDDDPSYVGALAKVSDPAALIGKESYFALRRHPLADTGSSQGVSTTASASLASKSGVFASLSETPVRFDVESKIATLLTEKMRMLQPTKNSADSPAPTLAVQQFRLTNGDWRYYARAEWREDTSPSGPPSFALGAWLAPDMRILAVERITSPYGFPDELPDLLNVVDLGDGTTGIIVNITESGEGVLGLWEYRDGADLEHMKNFQKLEMDE